MLVGLEIEKKYLVSDVNEQMLLAGAKEVISIEQHYLCDRKNTEVRIRKKVTGSDEKYVITVKSKGGLIRQEEESEINSEVFNMLKKFSMGTIKKVRYKFRRWDVDHYSNGRWTAEIELDAADENFNNNVINLPFLLGADVTEDSRYKNANLARRGWPKEKETRNERNDEQ